MVPGRIHALFGLIVGFILLRGASLFGQASQVATMQGEKEIRVSADRLSVEEEGRTIEAKGNVEIGRGDTVLKADEVRVNRTTQEVEAKGRVSVDDPEWKVKAEAVHLNLEQETGTIDQAEIFIERGHLSLGGSRFEKFVGQTYHIDQGFFTTCLCESGPPSWKMSAQSIDIRREGEGIVRGATFYVMDVPVFYLPYAYFPFKTERQTGLLSPRFGFSDKEGFRFEQPFFWAISKSSDATFGIDLESRARLGLLGEFRTVFSRDADAQIGLSYFDEGLRKREESSVVNETIADLEIPEDRWSVFATHRHTSSAGWKSYSDIFAFSDDLFLREIDSFTLAAPREQDLRTSRYHRSTFGLLQSWQDALLQGEWAFYQDFIQEDRRTLHRSPQILFRGRRFLGRTPFELRWRAEGMNYLRQEGANGARLDLRPELVLPFRVAQFLSGSLDVAPRQTLYHLYEKEAPFDRNESREIIEVRGQLGTSIGRVFELDRAHLDKLRHVIEPEVSYLFIPGTKHRDIPLFDGADRIDRRNQLTFALNQRLWAKLVSDSVADREGTVLGGLGDTRELGRLRIALGYDIDRGKKERDPLSDLDLDLRVTPLDYLAMGMTTGLNPGPWQVSQAAVHLSLVDPRPITRRVLDREFMRPNQLDLTYRFIRRGFLAELAENANLTTLTDERLIRQNVLGELGTRTAVHLTDHLFFLYDSNYDTHDRRFTNNRGSLKILSRCECWTISFTVNHRTNPDETAFRVDFSLLGLSSGNRGLFK